MFPVYFHQCENYDANKIKLTLDKLLKPFLGQLPPKKAKVLLKPNLLKGYEPEYAVTTHPTFIEAVILYGKEKDWCISVGDSPAISSVQFVAKHCGLAPILEKHNIPLIALDQAKDFKGDYKTLKIAKQLDNFDAIINLPKLKGHQQMYMTAAVKNLFGCVPGKRKALLHLNIGDKKDGSIFSRMLIDTAYQVKPVINIVDGIHSMAGNGPIHGQACHTHFIATSQDPLALDYALINELQGDLKADPIFRNIHQFGSYEKHTQIQIQWLSEKSNLNAFYFPKQRKPISFNPFIILRFIMRSLKAKILNPAGI